MENHNYPLEMRDVEPELAEKLLNYFTGLSKAGFVRVGPKGYFLPYMFRKEASKISSMDISPRDIFVSSYPRSGTTWTQELVWMVVNDLDYDTSNIIQLSDRYLLLELSIFCYSKEEIERNKLIARTDGLNFFTLEQIKQLSSPRFFKTHLPISLLPLKVLDTAKMVYIARDPRDVAVSFYHHHKLRKIMRPDIEFKTYWNLFIKNEVLWSPYFGHVLEAWDNRNHPNMLFLFYEDLSKDLPAAIQRVTKFFRKEVTDDQVARLSEHLKFKNFKKNKSVNLEVLVNSGLFTENHFIRKGKIGGWRDYFDEEMTRQAQKWIADNLRGTDFRFPHF